MPSICPAFDKQVSYLTESPIVCHQHRATTQRVRGNQQIKRRKYLALTLHIGPHTPIMLRNGTLFQGQKAVRLW